MSFYAMEACGVLDGRDCAMTYSTHLGPRAPGDNNVRHGAEQGAISDGCAGHLSAHQWLERRPGTKLDHPGPGERIEVVARRFEQFQSDMRKRSSLIRIVALITLASGAANVYWAMNPLPPERRRFLCEILPLEFLRFPRSTCRGSASRSVKCRS